MKARLTVIIIMLSLAVYIAGQDIPSFITDPLKATAHSFIDSIDLYKAPIDVDAFVYNQESINALVDTWLASDTTADLYFIEGAINFDVNGKLKNVYIGHIKRPKPVR